VELQLPVELELVKIHHLQLKYWLLLVALVAVVGAEEVVVPEGY
jgi:hypothetical protein